MARAATTSLPLRAWVLQVRDSHSATSSQTMPRPHKSPSTAASRSAELSNILQTQPPLFRTTSRMQTLATSTAGSPLVSLDTTSGAATVNLGNSQSTSATVQIGDIG